MVHGSPAHPFASATGLKSELFAIFLAAVCVAMPCAVLATDTLIIISPHRKSMQQEFIPPFREHYAATFGADVEVDWLDQGGTSDDLRFVRAKFAQNPQSSGIDIFWGGGTTPHVELASNGFSARYDLPAELVGQVPEKVAGIPLFDDSRTWVASAMSSFGIFYNKPLLRFDNLPTPGTWADLADPSFRGHLMLADPRRSGSFAAMNTIVMQSLGWEKGFRLLTMIAGNNRRFTHSSTDPIKAVVAGDAAAAMAIDFFAKAKVGDLGADNLGFALPPGQNVLDPDPVTILKGAPNMTVARRFVSFILSSGAQKFLILPRGAKDGPKHATLGRMAVNRVAYEETEGRRTDDFNPFEQTAFLVLDMKKASTIRRPFNDLLGATLIDTHSELKAAWAAIIARGPRVNEIIEIGTPPVTEADLEAMAARWGDDVYRNETINAWVAASRAKYKALAAGPLKKSE